ncbi:MAG TPA: hypothetical protein VMT34_11735 [Aggregatilineales bacterium]|nr:hypothetical protein [Aggregatilineales bacterium]
MCANFQSDQPFPREGYAPVENAELFYREVGHGRPIILIHGGPDFDHTYLLPDMDRLSDSYGLIYYDQGDAESLWVEHSPTTSVFKQKSKIWKV